ncbi:MAG TPA: GWxTD domain-containing protein [Gemmatimonadales bacterium]|nr:GWxTD domain-containing protein [Gemmatimonadales bacterium]
MRSPHLAFALAGLCAALPNLLAAQGPAERHALAALVDTLVAVSDTTALRRREDMLERPAKDRDGALARIRLGMVRLRLAELGASADAKGAVRVLRQAAERQSHWPYAWYTLGLAEAQRASWEQADRLALGSRVGVGNLERSAEHQRRALEADPAFVPAAVELSALTLGLRDTSLMGPAVAALRRAAAIPRARPAVLLAAGRVERAAGHLDSANIAFERFLASGGSRALALLELARTRLGEGRADGEAPYYEGAALDDPAAVTGYRADIEMIAADFELARFDHAHGPARAELLRRFWTDRDRLEMRRPGERIREHYRRLLHARRHFALTVSRRFYGAADAYRSGGMEIDDRGVIYVRHGEPAERLRPFVYGLMPNESWRFNRAEGDLLLHFSSGYDTNGGGDLYDYRLVESVLDLRGAGDAAEDDLLLSRERLSGVYRRMLHWGPYGAARSRGRERGIGRASIAVGTTTDSYELQFPRDLNGVVDMVAVGQVAGRTLAHLVFAVAEPGTRPERDAEVVRYTVRLRAVASDAGGRPFADLDTTIVFRPAAPLGRSQYLIGRAELSLPPGRWTWRAALQAGDSLGIVLPRDTVRVDRSVGGLSLSDLALGIRGASAEWEAVPGDTVLLTPFDLFPEGAEVELYYEAGGAIPNTAYRHDIAVFRVRGEPGVAERRPVVTLSFDESATDSLLRSHRVLQLERLKPGRYVIEVKLGTPEGEAAARRREFIVVRARS